MQNVLVVDNDRVFLGLMARFLEKKGYRVVTAEDGLTAIDALKTFTPDAIFIDLIMPNIDGKALCRIIRGMEAFKTTYLILLSAVSAEEWLDMEELGADACIAKGPFDEMSQHILAALEQPEAIARRCAAGEILGHVRRAPGSQCSRANRHRQCGRPGHAGHAGKAGSGGLSDRFV